MRRIRSLRRYGIAIALGLLLSPSAWAVDYTTTLTIQNPVLDDGSLFERLDQVIIRWSAPNTSGPVTIGDLTDYVIELYTADALGGCATNTNCQLLYTDAVIVNGVVQDFAGQLPRALANLTFDFNLANLTLSTFTNAENINLASTTGRQYELNGFVGDFFIAMRRFQNGTVDGSADADIITQTTRTALAVQNPIDDQFAIEDDQGFFISLANVDRDASQLQGQDTEEEIFSGRSVGQSFVVDAAGTLNAIELSLLETGSGGDLTVEILDFANQTPVGAPVLGTLNIPEEQLTSAPLSLQNGQITATLIDLSSLQITVNAGDLLAIRLRSQRPVNSGNYRLRRVNFDPYEDGDLFVEVAGIPPTFGGDAAFKVFITVPSINSVFNATDVTFTINSVGDDLFDTPQIELGELFLPLLPDAGGEADLILVGRTAGGDTAASNFTAFVDAVADPPILIADDLFADEDDIVQLLLEGFPSDQDGSEFVTLEIDGVPPQAQLNVGSQVGATTWLVDEFEIQDAELELVEHFSGVISLDLRLVSEEFSNGDSTDEFASIELTIEPVADAPALSVPGQLNAPEDTPLGFAVNADLIDTDGSETLTVSLDGLPGGFTLTDGSNQSISTSTDISTWDRANLVIVPAANFNGAFGLTTRAIATDSNGDQAQTTTATAVALAPRNDPPFVIDPLPVSITLDPGDTATFDVASRFDDVDIATNGDVLSFFTSSDNAIAVDANLNGGLLEVTALNPGTADVTLVAEDLGEASTSTIMEVIVTNTSPTLSPIISYSPNPNLPMGSNPIEGDFIYFDCAATVNFDPNTMTCSWSVVSASFGTQQAEGEVVVFVFPQQEALDVELTIDGPLGQFVSSETVVVDNSAPLVGAIDIEVPEGGTGEALCRFADPGVNDSHSVSFTLAGATALNPQQAAEENIASLSSGFARQAFSVAGLNAGSVLNASCTVTDDVDSTTENFTINILAAQDVSAKEQGDTDSSLAAPQVVAGSEVIARLESPVDIDVVEITTPNGLQVGGEFVLRLQAPADFDLLVFARSTSANVDASPFVNAPFVNAPFVNAPFVNVPFVNAPFVNAPFVNAPFVNAPFVNAPFVNAPFVNAPFVNAPLNSSPFVNAGFEFEDFPLSQVGLAAPDGSNLSGIDIGLDELGSSNLGALEEEGLTPVAFSASTGKQDEAVLLRVGPGTDSLYAVIVSSSGAYSDEPYSLRVEASVPPSQEQLIGAQCLRPPLVANPGSAIEVLHPQGTPRTLIVTQRERMMATHGLTQAQFEAFISQLQPFFDHPEVLAEVISVPGDIYQTADMNQCRIDEQNLVTDAIRTIIQNRVANSGISYVQIMGGVDIIPPRYAPDESTVGYEGLYVQDLLMEPGRPIAVAFAEGNNITDAAYVDFEPLPFRGRALYLEDLSISRMVETPNEILAAANNFVAANGLITNDDALVAGYDFFIDGSRATAEVLSAVSQVNDSLISDDWKGDDLRCGFLDSANKPLACPVNVPSNMPDVAVVNFHGTYNAGISAFGFNNLANATSADEVIEALESRMAQPDGFVLTIACHTGLSVPDRWALPNGVGLPLDPAQDWAQQPGTWVGPWNYGLGDDTVADRGTEGLVTLVAQELAGGATLGEAVVRAKQRYTVGLFEFDVHDEKSVIGLALFGMPQARFVTTGPKPDLPVVLPPGAQPAGTLDLLVRDNTGATITNELIEYQQVTTGNGEYFPLAGRAQGVVGRPLLPVTLPIDAEPVVGDRIHDVIVTGGAYDDMLNIDPVFAYPQHDWVASISEPRACVDVFAPTQLGIATGVQVGVPGSTTVLESVIALGAQFKCTLTPAQRADQAVPVRGTLRKFEALELVAQRPANAAIADDFDPPTVLQRELILTTGSDDVQALLDATDPNGLREIVALIFRDDDGIPGGTGTVESVSTGPISGPGPYTLTLPNARGLPLAFQFVDNAGNAILKTAKGALTRALQVGIATTSITAQNNAPVDLTLIDAANLEAPEVTVDFGDGAFATVELFDANGTPTTGVTIAADGSAAIALTHDYSGFSASSVTISANARSANGEGTAVANLAVTQGALLGDLNADQCVDRTDYRILITDIRNGPPNNPAYDLNGDGTVSRADARTLIGLFTNPRGASCP
ncbi:MAG: dockerin type I domain-containing protein [Pseudomonadota bacterium]